LVADGAIAPDATRPAGLARWRPRWGAFPIVLYPVATPAAAVLYLGTLVASHPVWLIRPLLIAIAIALVLIVVLTVVLRDKHRAGIAAWALLVGLIAGDPRASAMLFVVALAVLAVGIALRTTPWERGPRVSGALTVFGAVLIAGAVVRALQLGSLQASIAEVAFDLERLPAAPAAAADAPDVYVLLLDAYPGREASRQEPSFDADAFPDALRARGFDVADRSRSNYLTTRLSLPSMLDAGYLDTQSQLVPATHAEDARALRVATDRSRVLARLRGDGFETVAIASGFSEIGPYRVDRLIAPPQINELEWAILDGTTAGGLLSRMAPTYVADDVRARVVTTLDAAAGVAREPHDRPRFVLTHVPAPHAPWVATEGGDPRADTDDAPFGGPTMPASAVEQRRQAYFGYASWVASQTLATVDRIMAASDRPPVILVVSDHGPDFAFSDADPLSYDLRDRTSNFIAALVPGHDNVVPDDLTLVNLFPVVLDASLGWDLPVRPDRFFAWPAGGSIVDFIELDPATLRPS